MRPAEPLPPVDAPPVQTPALAALSFGVRIFEPAGGGGAAGGRAGGPWSRCCTWSSCGPWPGWWPRLAVAVLAGGRAAARFRAGGLAGGGGAAGGRFGGLAAGGRAGGLASMVGWRTRPNCWPYRWSSWWPRLLSSCCTWRGSAVSAGRAAAPGRNAGRRSRCRRWPVVAVLPVIELWAWPALAELLASLAVELLHLAPDRRSVLAKLKPLAGLLAGVGGASGG